MYQSFMGSFDGSVLNKTWNLSVFTPEVEGNPYHPQWGRKGFLLYIYIYFDFI